jgi:ABC-2 type transport system ATP-binding protein
LSGRALNKTVLLLNIIFDDFANIYAGAAKEYDKAMKTVVKLKDVSVNLAKNKVLRNISLDLPEGKEKVLLGTSGAGKTTFMRVIMGLQRVAGGSVEVLGMKAGAAQLRPLVGYVTQAPSVYADLTVTENLRYFGAMVNVGAKRVDEVIGLVRLGDQADQLAGKLSGGQLARVSLAVALLGSPRLLVLDEPTVGLDPVLRLELWEQFHELADNGVTLLVSSHVMDEARRCDELVLMREGQILAAGTPSELMKRTMAADVETAFLKLVEAA